MLILQFLKKISEDALLADMLGDRFCTDRAPQGGKMPYCVLYELFTEPIHQLDGESGMSRTTFQLDFWADGADGQLIAKRCAYRVRDQFKGGFVGVLVPNGIHISSLQITRVDILGNRPQDGSDNYFYRGSLDIQVVHEDSTADVETALPLLP